MSFVLSLISRRERWRWKSFFFSLKHQHFMLSEVKTTPLLLLLQLLLQLIPPYSFSKSKINLPSDSFWRQNRNQTGRKRVSTLMFLLLLLAPMGFSLVFLLRWWQYLLLLLLVTSTYWLTCLKLVPPSPLPPQPPHCFLWGINPFPALKPPVSTQPAVHRVRVYLTSSRSDGGRKEWREERRWRGKCLSDCWSAMLENLLWCASFTFCFPSWFEHI